jgi:hypothetical protein
MLSGVAIVSFVIPAVFLFVYSFTLCKNLGQNVMSGEFNNAKRQFNLDEGVRCKVCVCVCVCVVLCSL